MNEEEWNETLIQDLEFLKEAGFIDVVGINEEGEWLYGLTPKTKSVIDKAAIGDDLYDSIATLLDEATKMQDIKNKGKDFN